MRAVSSRCDVHLAPLAPLNEEGALGLASLLESLGSASPADAAAPRCFRSFDQFIRRIGHSRRTTAPYLTNTAKYRICGGNVVIAE